MAAVDAPTDLNLHEWTCWTVLRDGGTFSCRQLVEEMRRRALNATGRRQNVMSLAQADKALRSLVARELVDKAGQFAYRRVA
jgi:hypothetical protein